MCGADSLTKSQNSGFLFERFDFCHSFFRGQELRLVIILSRKNQDVFSALTDKLARKNKELMTQGFDGGSQFVFRQAKPLEPMHEVVSQKQQLEKSNVSRPALGGNFVQRQISEQLAD